MLPKLSFVQWIIRVACLHWRCLHFGVLGVIHDHTSLLLYCMLAKNASSWYLAFLRGGAICKVVDCSCIPLVVWAEMLKVKTEKESKSKILRDRCWWAHGKHKKIKACLVHVISFLWNLPWESCVGLPLMAMIVKISVVCMETEYCGMWWRLPSEY